MAQFAQLDENNVVTQVIIVADEDAPDPTPELSEPVGVAFLKGLGLGTNWKQTCPEGTFRKTFASIGYLYSPEADVFYPPQPHPSWTLDGNYDWIPPVPVPEEDGIVYDWDEANQAWVPLNA